MSTSTTTKHELLKLLNDLNCMYCDGALFYTKPKESDKDVNVFEEYRSNDPHSPYSGDKPAHVEVKVTAFRITSPQAFVEFLPKPIIDVRVTLDKVRLDVTTHNLPRFRLHHMVDIMATCAGTLADAIEDAIELYLTGKHPGNTFRVNARCNLPVFAWNKAFAEDLYIVHHERDARNRESMYTVNHLTGKLTMRGIDVESLGGRMNPPDDVEEAMDYVIRGAKATIDHDDLVVELERVWYSDDDEEFEDAEDAEEKEFLVDENMPESAAKKLKFED